MTPQSSHLPSRAARAGLGMLRWAGRWAGIAIVGAWLVAKQLLWSPSLQDAPLRAAPVAASLAVALLVIAVAVRFRGRAQLVVLLLLDGALTALFHVHVLYHRQFSELASVAALTFASQAPHVGGAVLALFRPGDAALWADVAALAIAAAALPAGPALAPRRGPSIALAVAGVLLFIAPALPLLDRPLTGPRHLALGRAEVAAGLNVVGYQLYDIFTFVQRRLDRSGRASLPQVLEYHRARAAPPGPLSATERGRNVIVVHLESMQGFAVGRHLNGVPVTPSLDRLATESITFTRAFTQAGQGTSSDAELLAGCSLYPLETGAVFTDRYDVDFRCLPEVLRDAGYRTLAMHANWANFWNRDRMYPAMGYDQFLSIKDFDRTPVIGLGLSDVRFVEQAAERIEALPEPFYAVLITLSNHAPFDDPNVPRTLPLGSLADTYVGDYLDSVRFMDSALGAFVDRLRATGILDRSVLVVYGDHAGVARNAPGTELLDLPLHRADVWLLHEQHVPLLVRLPRGRGAQVRHEPVGQVDIAPTIADLLGVPRDQAFFHGRSLVSDPPRPVVMTEGSAISEELVHLGNEGRWGVPGCVDAATGSPVERERCAALAEHAAQELAVSRAAVNQDLFRWMLAGAEPPTGPPETTSAGEDAGDEAPGRSFTPGSGLPRASSPSTAGRVTE